YTRFESGRTACRPRSYDEDRTDKLNMARSGNSSAVHQGRDALKSRKGVPTSMLRPPERGRWPEEAPKRAFARSNRTMLLTGEHTMRHVDFSPLYRSTVGFDRLFTMLDSLGQPD